jgi:drug/metabolite transporter (DMT)-like permease
LQFARNRVQAEGRHFRHTSGNDFAGENAMNIMLYLAVVLIWGTTWIAIFLQQEAANTPVLVAVLWRFLLASVLMLVILKLIKRLRPLDKQDHLFCLLQGCCVFGFNFVCFYHAAAWISSGLESVIFSMAVLYNALNSWIFFRQRPPFRLLPAAVLGLGGIVALFWHDIQAAHPAPQLLWGVGLSALGTLGFSFGNMISTRHQRRQRDVLTTNSYAMFYGAIMMAILALLNGDSLAPTFNLQWLGSMSYLAIFGSVLGFGAYFTLVGRIGASQAAYSTLLFPLVALTLSTIYEGYQWHDNAIVGLVMILMGNMVMFVRWPTSRKLRLA